MRSSMNTDAQGRNAGGSGSGNFWMQMLYLPVTIFMTTIDTLGRMMGVSQRTMTNVGSRGRPIVSNSAFPVVGTNSQTEPISVVGISNAISNFTAKENNGMGGEYQDLSGDNVKNVVYSIVFTKRDLEAPLKTETEELVNYDTDGASFGALKIAEFAGESFARPDNWAENDYPRADSGSTLSLSDIPQEDRRYVRFSYRVRDRFAKSDDDYDRRQTRALEGIERNTKRL
jgi:hypothetical protein